MRQLQGGLLVAGLCAAGCGVTGPQTVARTASGLAVLANSVTHFEALYVRAPGDGARVEVRYSPSTTFFEVDTLDGETLFVDGTEQVSPPLRLHPRAPDGASLRLTSSDPELAAVQGLLQQVEALGVGPIPSPVQKGSTAYAAAYVLARILGEVSRADGAGAPTRWPYPGYTDAAALPPELQGDAQTNGFCCGPIDCSDCNYSPAARGSLNNWCAAGDQCNTYRMWDQYPGGNCGSIWLLHQNSSIINFNRGPAEYCDDPYAGVCAWNGDC